MKFGDAVQSADWKKEKHVPVIEIGADSITVKVGSVAELVDKLKNEAGVL